MDKNGNVYIDDARISDEDLKALAEKLSRSSGYGITQEELRQKIEEMKLHAKSRDVVTLDSMSITDRVEIPPLELPEIAKMNRHQRRAWYAQQRKKK